ncbi:MAG: DMT family transporter, partial [Betaproteobacteria bacterium]|nr:DMT family transporter [Betaproteobacteria bacterium]
MGFALALLAMLSFAANMILTRYAIARMPVESGFLFVLGTNVLFPALLYGGELAIRTAPYSWDLRGCALFVLAGVVGIFLGRRALFDTVRLLGPSRASVFHSSAPVVALLGAWLLAHEALGAYELALVAVVWVGLWLTQPPAGSRPGETRLSRVAIRRGLLAGLFAVAGFGFGNVLRGLAMRQWEEPLLGTVIAALSAFVLQVAVTRDWHAVRAQVRKAGAPGVWIYVACGIATSFGSVFITAAMAHMKIGLAALIMHTTPVVVFPMSALLFKQREEINGRTLAG